MVAAEEFVSYFTNLQVPALRGMYHATNDGV